MCPVRLAYQPTLLFSRNKPTTSAFLSEQISTSHQPNEQADEYELGDTPHIVAGSFSEI
jgi:hypothetical protein